MRKSAKQKSRNSSYPEPSNMKSETSLIVKQMNTTTFFNFRNNSRNIAPRCWTLVLLLERIQRLLRNFNVSGKMKNIKTDQLFLQLFLINS